jgi:hypothetical protein
MTNKNSAVSLIESFINNTNGPVTILEVWEAYKRFCLMESDKTEEPELLFQCGVRRYSDKSEYYFDFTKQITLFQGKEYSHMEQIHCQFIFNVEDDLIVHIITKWAEDEDYYSFFNQIEQLEIFKLMASRTDYLKKTIFQEEI